MKSFLLTLLAIIVLIQVSHCLDCPKGWHDEIYKGNPYCYRSYTYGRGTGYALKFGEFDFDNAKKRCKKDHPQGCEKNGGFVYPKCWEGFDNDACCICSFRNCPSGYKDANIYWDDAIKYVACEPK